LDLSAISLHRRVPTQWHALALWNPF
jgi:hypothetical protein